MKSSFANNQNDMKIDNSLDLPMDTVSLVLWHPTIPKLFGASSWDCTFRVYALNDNNSFSMQFRMDFDEPLTTFEFKDEQFAFVGTATGNILAVDMKNAISQIIGSHKEPILRIFYLKDQECLVSFETGKQIYMFDLVGGNKAEVMLESEAMCADAKSTLFAVGCGNNKIAIFSYANLQQNEITYLASSLSSKISCIALHENNTCVAVGGYDGRMNHNSIVSKLHSRELKDNLTFKAYADKRANGHTDLYPINFCEYAPNIGSKVFYTISSSGILKNWEYQHRELCSQYAYNAPITAAAFNKKSQLIILATGYDWSLGVWGLGMVKEAPEIIIKQFGKNDFICRRNA